MAENNQVIAQAVQRAEADNYMLSVKEIGGGAGALIAMAMAFSAWWSKHHNKNTKVDKAEGNFVETLQGEQNRLIDRIKALEADRENCRNMLESSRSEMQNRLSEQNSDMAVLKSQVSQVQILEADNLHLRQRLNEKDVQIEEKNQQIQGMISALMAKDNYILELTERVHNLELRLTKDEREFCKDCKFKGVKT